ncbi:tRNA (adenosine(37)-N6)-dimethylallyltransferase MiaA [Haliangium ochraceum]|uniref:tRNA dimethylallyltransferase n=1 Tax=Haliangium ochraceum (strain DSM 14365 / JCM 11303 / SMP-2) TaxID=502025 RepID=D0LXB3_HALO1|nr:tRNA (adenosine(37)-N6)-dimethylallyltransferase MiaA [Haliangium ochraceum]ACY16155.1 tRNA delta(2)-isopentenylpyrophosphate transferase [Haliangium ochraceum DSM 14365]
MTGSDTPRPPLVVIVGPTASGKSDAALALAERVGGEVVSADSQQVYTGMDIGTGKVSAEVRARVPHHLLDVISPAEEMTAARFVELADRVIADASARGRPVIVAGGTGLYVRALLFGLFEGPPAQPALRERLRAEAEAGGGAPALWQRLRAVDAAGAARIDHNDLRRIIRALEVFETTGVPMSVHQARHDFRTLEPRYPVRMLGLAPAREQLYKRIDTRVEAMVEAGLVAEVEALRAAGIDRSYRSQAAIGYAELHEHLDGALPLADAIARIQQNSRRYARRQLSWYRRDPRVAWASDLSVIDLPALERYLRSRPQR